MIIVQKGFSEVRSRLISDMDDLKVMRKRSGMSTRTRGYSEEFQWTQPKDRNDSEKAAVRFVLLRKNQEVQKKHYLYSFFPSNQTFATSTGGKPVNINSIKWLELQSSP